MNIPFREHHLFALLNEYEKQTLPLDLFISHYFRDHKSLGSKDRGYVAETIYSLIRWKGLLDHITNDNASWQDRLEAFQELDIDAIQTWNDIPPYIRVSFPKVLYDLLEASYGPARAMELCLFSNSAAPTTVRANLLKTTREALLKSWQTQYEVIPTQFSDAGITFLKKINFFGLPEFKAGLFEVQDEGSQLLANMIRAKPGDLVLDYCAGSGGKTLAFAPQMEGKGQIYLHDIRPFALMEAKKRLKRAGIQNGQVLKSDSPNLAKLKKKMDWVLIDAPCTGTGTLRRNPDMKWKFDDEMLKRLLGVQRTIFEKGLSFMHPEGRIVYSTCSMLKEENQDQLDHFLKTYSLVIEGDVFHSFPSPAGMDGFFGVVLKKH